MTSETGFLIEPLDRAYVVSRIAEQMDYLARNPKVARAMGERGRAAIENQFSWDAKIRKILAIYRNACRKIP